MNTISKILLGIIFLFFVQKICAQTKVNFDESSYQTILKRSKTEKKPIFLMVYATWCQHCNKMKSEVFTDTTIAGFLNKNFICVWQDAEKDEGKMLLKKFDIKSFPTFIFLDENENALYGLKGEFKVSDFLEELKNALNPVKQLPYLKQQFLNNPKNSENCLAYLFTLRKAKNRSDLNPYAHQYLSTQTDDQLVSVTNWKVISNGVSDINSREFQYVLKHKKEFSEITSSSRVNKKILNIVGELLQPIIDNLDSIQYKKERLTAKSIQDARVDSLVFRFDLTFFERAKNWQEYKKTCIENVERLIYNDDKTIKEIGQVFLKNISEEKDLKLALKWNLHAIESKESYDGLILISRIYLKIKNKELAILYARKAKELTKNMGWNSKEADDLFIELEIK